MHLALSRLAPRQVAAALLVSLAAIVLAGGWWIWQRTGPSGSREPQGAIASAGDIADSKADATADATAAAGARAQEGTVEVIDFPEALWASASIEIQQAKRAPLAQTVELTGKIALNDDRVAHIFPLVDGRVEQVKVQFGDTVKKDDLLVVVQSKEVGQTMLQLFQNRLQQEFAATKDRWTQEVTTNTQAMIKLIRQEVDIEEIEKQLANRPMGEYRDKLMSAYIDLYKTRKHLDRLAPLSQSGTVTGKQLLEAETQWNAARATMQSLTEQIQHEAQQASILSAHSVKELQTRVAVDETNLKILGFTDEDLVAVDPATRGESLAHYPIYAPFDGTIITKDVVLMERVAPERQILSLADLSTVWVTTDIYEEHLPLLTQLENQTIRVRCDAWPSDSFEARIFYTGDVVDESSRTISMRAVADNPRGLLKPGMFVNVEFPSLTQADVLQIPSASVLEHEGESFVFIQIDQSRFARRNVTTGRRNAESVEIRSGLEAGEKVVTRGGFALKSRMLAELLEE